MMYLMFLELDIDKHIYIYMSLQKILFSIRGQQIQYDLKYDQEPIGLLTCFHGWQIPTAFNSKSIFQPSSVLFRDIKDIYVNVCECTVCIWLPVYTCNIIWYLIIYSSRHHVLHLHVWGKLLYFVLDPWLFTSKPLHCGWFTKEPSGKV